MCCCVLSTAEVVYMDVSEVLCAPCALLYFVCVCVLFGEKLHP